MYLYVFLFLFSLLLLFDQVEEANILLTFSKNTLLAEIWWYWMVGTTGADGEDTRSWKLEEFYNADDRLPNGEPGGESKCAMGFFFFFFTTIDYYSNIKLYSKLWTSFLNLL